MIFHEERAKNNQPPVGMGKIFLCFIYASTNLIFETLINNGFLFDKFIFM
jgi:hypothetical protein